MLRQHRFGLYGELLTAIYYKLHFYKIIKHRARNHAGEIDLIVLRGKTIAFIEVKSRRKPISHQYQICSPKQFERIQNSAMLFLQAHPQYQAYDIRFDIVVVKPYSLPEVFYNVQPGLE